MMKSDKIPCTSIIFDCDGVIFDSNQLKIEAFRKTLSVYPADVVEAFILYHIQNAGISRYVKFRAFIVDFLGITFVKEEYEELLDNFGRKCRELYLQASLTPGSSSVLKKLSDTVPLYVASGSDELELNDVFKQRQLHNYFVKVLGSPKTKSECVLEALKDIGSSKNVVMIGDARSDWLAAQEVGISFIYMSRFSENHGVMTELSKKHGFCEIETLEQLKDILDFKD